MPAYSVAEAKNNLPKLLDRAIAGEEVTITRRGKTVARIVSEPAAVSRPGGPKSPRDVDWVRRSRVHPRMEVDAVELIRRMRDEGH
jgi:prevent-host-death family protein